MGLVTTTAGWFPKPLELRRARWRFSEGEIGEAELGAAEAQAIEDVLKWQEELGLDVFVDGQMDRSDTVTFFAEKLEGMEPAGLVRCFGNRYYRKPRIEGDVAWPGPLTVPTWKRAQDASPKPVKAVLTGPYTMMDWSFDEHYRSREACCEALAGVVRAEAEALVAAGAVEIQIDEPAISARPEEMELAAEALGRVTEPLRGKARVWAHLCYGDLLPVVEGVFGLPVDGLLLEMANSRYELLERLGEFPDDKLLAAGVLDVQSHEVEDPGEIRARVERLLEHVPAGRLWLAPDAGLRTLPRSLADSKLRSLTTVGSFSFSASNGEGNGPD